MSQNALYLEIFMNKYPFDPLESLAVAKLIWVLLFSDESIDRQESDFFEQVLHNFDLSSEDFETFLSEPVEHSYEIVKSMSAEKRRQCVKLLRMAVDSDKIVKLSELSRLNEILERTELFRPDKKNTKKTDEGFVNF